MLDCQKLNNKRLPTVSLAHEYTFVCKQSGLSLIELMIALALGVFIVAGIFQATTGSKQAFEVIQAQSTTQETGRFATQFVADTTRNAGYINLGSIQQASGDAFAQELIDALEFSENKNTQWKQVSGFSAGAVIAGGDDASVGGYADAIAGSDFLTVRMQGDGSYDDATRFSMSDCEGRMLASDVDTTTVIHYYVSDSKTLVCRVDLVGATNSTGSVVELVSGVEEMQIVYAVREQGGAVSFKRATDVDADEWREISSIRLAFLSVSDNQPLDAGLNREFDMLGETRQDAGDGRVRQVFYQTIAVRN